MEGDSRSSWVEIDVSESSQKIDEIIDAISRAMPGTRIVYFKGNVFGGSAVARRLRALQEEGVVDLVQRRVQDAWRENYFEYIAIKRSTLP